MEIYAFTQEDPGVTTLEVPTPEPHGSEVLLAVRHSGVCHTDMHLLQGGYDLGSRGFLRMSERGVAYPLVAGHEIVGEVVAVGPDVTQVRPGDLRLVYPWLGCGECAQCRADRENYCAAGRMLGIQRRGGFATHVQVPHERYLVDVEGLDPVRAATLACSGLTSYAAVDKVLPLEPDELVVVIGAGGVGLMGVAVLHARGHRRIAVLDVNDDRLAVASGMGPQVVTVNTSGRSSAEVLTALGGPVPAVLDFVNNGPTATLAFDLLAKGGHLVSVGLFGGEVCLPTALVAMRALTLQGSFVGTLDQLHELVALARGGGLPEMPIVPGRLDAAQLEATLGDLAAGAVRGRVVLSPGPATHPHTQEV